MLEDISCGAEAMAAFKNAGNDGASVDRGALVPRLDHVGQMIDGFSITGPALQSDARLGIVKVQRGPVGPEIGVVALGPRGRIEDHGGGLAGGGPQKIGADGGTGVGKNANGHRSPIHIGRTQAHPGDGG